MKQSPPLYAHIRPFLFWSKEGSNLQIKNLTLHPITVHSVYLTNSPERNLLKKKMEIPRYKLGNTEHIVLLPIIVSDTNGANIAIEYFDPSEGNTFVEDCTDMYPNCTSNLVD